MKPSSRQWMRIGLVASCAAALHAQEAAASRAEVLAERARREGLGIVPELLPLLDHADWHVRWRAVRGIGLARAEWLDERLATMLDDEAVAPMAAYALGQLTGQASGWPPLDRHADLVAAAKRWWQEQASGEGWVTHDAALAPDLGTTVLGRMHAERGTAYLVVRDTGVDREYPRQRWSGPIRCAAFSGDSARFAVSDDRGRVHAFATARRELLRTLDGHRGWVRSLALSRDGALVASSAQDGVLLVRSIADGDVVWRRSDSEMSDLEFLSAGDGLVGADCSGRLLGFSTNGAPRTLGEDLPPVADLAVAPDDRCVAVLHVDGSLALWDRSARSVAWSKAAHGPRPRGVEFGSDGTSVATAGSDRRVRLWSTRDGALLGDFACQRNVIALRCVPGAIVGALADGTTWRQPLDSSKR